MDPREQPSYSFEDPKGTRVDVSDEERRNTALIAYIVKKSDAKKNKCKKKK
jgi:hypothetical protein